MRQNCQQLFKSEMNAAHHCDASEARIPQFASVLHHSTICFQIEGLSTIWVLRCQKIRVTGGCTFRISRKYVTVHGQCFEAKLKAKQ